MRLISLIAHVAASNFGPCARPYRIGLSVTDRCNLRCSSCGIWKTTDHNNELTLDELRRIFAGIPFCSWLNLTGGEIFLRDDIAEILDAAAAIPSLYFLNFTTNGSMPEHTERIVSDFLKKHPHVKLVMSVSLDGPQTVHDRLRGKNGAWENATETYRRLRALRNGNFSVYFGMTMQNENADLYAETIAAADAKIGSVSARDVHVNFAHLSPNYYRNTDVTDGIFSPDASYIHGLVSARRLSPIKPFDIVERIYLRLFGKYRTTGHCPLPCRACDVSCFIDAKGIVYPCVGDGRIIGNLRETGYDIMPLWHSAARRSIRKEIAHGHCPQCWTPCEAYQTIGGSLLKTLWTR